MSYRNTSRHLGHALSRRPNSKPPSPFTKPRKTWQERSPTENSFKASREPPPWLSGERKPRAWSPPTAEDFHSIVFHPQPGRSSNGPIIAGDPESFPGQNAYLYPTGWNKALPENPWSWVNNFHLLSGPSPIPKLPVPWKPYHRAGSMTNHVDIATVPTADTGGSLLLHFDHRRYLFGRVSEGTQRALTQRKYALAKLEKLFLSGQTSWETMGGLLGMMLTVADVLDGSRRDFQQQNETRKKTGKPELAMKGPECIEVHGARNLAYSIATARSFIFRKGIPIRPFEVNEDPRLADSDKATPDFEDDAISVWKVPIFSETSPVSVTSRKRSHEVMTAEDEALQDGSSAAVTPEQQQKIDLESIHATVDHMFNSDWSLDALCETKLHKVSLPATIFVREDGHIKRYRGPLPGDKNADVPDIDVLVRYPWPATMVKVLPPPAAGPDMSVCYVVKNKGRRGKMNPAVAIQRGVPKFRLKELADGKTVKDAKGEDVTPDMVMGAPLKPCGFAVIDMPNTSMVDSFLARPEWKNTALLDNVPVFYWILGPSVIDDARIQSFMKERSDIRHKVIAPDVSPNMLSFESHALMLAKLRRIDPERFPLLDFNNTVRDLSSIGSNVEAGRVGARTNLSPVFGFKDDEIAPFPTFEEANNLEEDILAMAKTAQAKIQDPKFLADVEQAEQDIPNRDAEVIPLGTGSALPSKYRNVSSTLVRVPQYGNYLLDCGENTVGQLRRAFPADEAKNILENLRCIVISHMHADHQLGTASMLRAWAKATAHLSPQPKLGVIGPKAIEGFLREYSRIEDIAWDRLIFPRPIWPKTTRAEFPADHPTGLASAFLVPVEHCQHAFAPVLTWPSGLKIAYSGDCRPSADLVEVGRGATLLIHESTFDDDMMSDALAKKHSTMGEALDVADRMGARRVLLTHFSQRYARIPLVESRRTRTGADQVVLLALDQMRVKLGEFRHAQAFLPAIRRFFETDSEKTKEED
ncbi:tRNA processing endoribonuclease [Colletotrichum sojae]|uniref:ribonuclease Z n=1 Tax=Colletotrichum sojae TaxID=2175907 RepID=A0A8H6JXT4_9PEZI|nr:tRNA processing endoribonuclease [Colletotrichum sojae]